MKQELAEQKIKSTSKQNSQNYRILEIWNKTDKSSFEKETDPLQKTRKKADLYTLIVQKYEEKWGKQINRSTVRRCINTEINTNSQG